MSKIIGYREVSYVNKKTNVPVQGFELFLVSPVTGKGDGLCWRWQFNQPTRPAFVSVDTFKKIHSNIKTQLLNVECEPSYNEYGRITNIEFYE